MNSRRRAHFIALLLQERSRIARSLERIAASTPGVLDHAPGVDGEAGSSGLAPEVDSAIAAHEAVALAEVDEALRLLYETPANYGSCLTCDEPIPLKRLEILPAARYCERHARVPTPGYHAAR